jgi:putative methionine-R-sulfoxide reductase with GAF domain
MPVCNAKNFKLGHYPTVGQKSTITAFQDCSIFNSVGNWYSYRFLFASEHGMTSDFTPDPESFQRLLSNAFAVQESGMDAESLTEIVELQRAIATGEADVDRAMDLIAAGARNVANATGIAIGLLQGDQLVYRAGSGSGVTYVGQHVMATLCVSGRNAASGEILRVENAQTDRRIEAAICRQFGAQSLLILPIYHDGTMTGVLDVLFDEAHAFQHREVLTYRLMAALVGEAISYAARPDQKPALAADLSSMRQSIRLTRPPPREEALNDRASVPVAATNRALYQAFGTFIARAGKLPGLTQSAWAVLKRAKHVPWYRGRWETAVGVAAVLVIACWIGFRDGRPASPLGVSGLQGSNALEQQMPFAPAKRVLPNSMSKPQTAPGLESGERKTSRSIPQRVLDRNIRVRYISDDVTVRYFTPNPAVAPPSPAGSPAQPVSR